ILRASNVAAPTSARTGGKDCSEPEDVENVDSFPDAGSCQGPSVPSTLGTESNEGGASSGELPQLGFGMLLRSKPRVVVGLLRMVSTGSHRLVLRTPLIFIRST